MVGIFYPFPNYVLSQYKRHLFLSETFSVYDSRHGICILFMGWMLCANILATDAVGLAFPGNS